MRSVDGAQTENRAAPVEPRPALLDLAPVGFAWSDAEGNISYVNPHWRELFDYTGPVPVTLGVMLRQIDAADRATLAQKVGRGHFHSVKATLRRIDGKRHLALAIQRIPEESDPHFRYIGVAHDVTELSTALEEVHRSEELFRTVASTLPIAVFRTDPNGIVTWANDWLKQWSEGDATRDIGSSAFDVVHPEDRPEVRRRVAEAIAHDKPFRSEHRFVAGDGEIKWVITRTTAVRDAAGQVIEYLGTMEDITALRARTDILAHAAAHDPLTGLPNRATLIAQLEGLTAAKPGRNDIGVIFLDLDGFKDVNDSAGHQAGDQVLIEVAERLRASIRTRDTVSRFGGDEFVIVCPEISDFSLVEAVAQRAVEAISATPFVHAGQEHHVGASVGVVLGPGPGRTAGGLLHRADAAMYQAKRRGTGPQSG